MIYIYDLLGLDDQMVRQTVTETVNAVTYYRLRQRSQRVCPAQSLRAVWAFNARGNARLRPTRGRVRARRRAPELHAPAGKAAVTETVNAVTYYSYYLTPELHAPAGDLTREP